MSPSPFSAQIRHNQDLDDQTRPARKMLCSLSLTRFGVILFPCKARPLPFSEHILDEILPQFGVYLSRLLLMRT